MPFTDYTGSTLVATLVPMMYQSDLLAHFPAVATAIPQSVVACSLSTQDYMTTHPQSGQKFTTNGRP